MLGFRRSWLGAGLAVNLAVDAWAGPEGGSKAAWNSELGAGSSRGAVSPSLGDASRARAIPLDALLRPSQSGGSVLAHVTGGADAAGTEGHGQS